MNNIFYTLRTGLIASLLILGTPYNVMAESGHNESAESEHTEPEKGVHGGRLLKDGDFVVELSIFEKGVPPEFRTWVTLEGQPVDPKEVSLNVTLSRLGGVEDNINFTVQDDFLRGDMEIYEPHSFEVTLQATYQGKTYEWHYDNFEGRVKIKADIAEAMEIKTEIASSAVLKQSVPTYGKLAVVPGKTAHISARFDGIIKKVYVHLGQKVNKGQRLLTVESNESLKSYNVTSPINGYVTQVNVAIGERTQGKDLLQIENQDELTAELLVFPAQTNLIKPGLNVSLSMNNINQTFTGSVTQIDRQVLNSQARVVRVRVNNQAGKLSPGMFVKGDIEVTTFTVPLAVKRKAIQSFRDFKVVFAKIGEEYEVRMLKLGRVSGDWVEVLGGLKAGTEYVTQNSYIIKADIEKSGASHDH
ncbi:MAG: efflux RND transporter periplasmic adaptor subunit [Hydrogenovibrio crunogenus]|uniref:RND membrane fusion protein n=1 Tax=Hydrogenovibrio crunogenus (strain DSM 25203 / XCL-2) TaxID=317025 RepID=Q31DT8_HYDCU|nr:efflux RND transporter periplasmic adaptor subunit [Hydrogenovibrio crunogenus]